MHSKIIELFHKYGFEYRKSASGTDFLAFTYKSGFFHNAELVSLNYGNRDELDSEMEKSLKSLEELGFSTKKSFYKSFEEIEETLFNGFFNVSEWKDKIKNEYIEHTQKILNILPKEAENYQYINTLYMKNNKIDTQKNIVEDICRNLELPGPLLTIVEAPAGFGKTCTSYEIINNLAKSQNKKTPIPFFTEFARDRQARIFSHIFIREVDKTFSSVNSEVVIEEVKSGRIVVVLDGFDEILHDNSNQFSDTKENHFENAEPMLETIGELLTNNAKVILTSRRSAIFDGEIFNEWLARYDQKFRINRYKIEKPEVKDWLTPTRLEALSNAGLDVYKLANPVLLSYLRFISDETFKELCSNPTKIVDHYFFSMLEREMDRQELRMNPEQQSKFLALIAEDMYENNYTSDTKEKLISTIKNKASNILNEVRTLYSAKERPTLDKLATTLSNHAFFDRSNSDENKIEFVNEFVFGNYIATNIIEYQGDWVASDERFVEPAVLSFVPRDTDSRMLLWDKLGMMKDFLDSSSRMKFESLLTNLVDDNVYDQSEITSLNIKDVSLFPYNNIKNSLFNECVFNNSSINFDNFRDVTFLNCSFWNCNLKINENSDLNFFNCKSNDKLPSIFDEEEVIETNSTNNNFNLSEIELYILDKIWPSTSDGIMRLHFFVGNILKSDKYDKKSILKGIRSLKRLELLTDANDTNFVAVNKEKIGEIKNILGKV